MPGFRWFVPSSVRSIIFAALALFPCSAADELRAAPGDILHTFTAPADQIGYTYGSSFGILGDNIYVSGVRPNLTFVANMYDRQSYAPERTITLPAPAGATTSNYDWRDVAAHGDRLLVSGIQSGAFGRVSLVNGTTGSVIRTYRHPALSTQDGFGLSVAFAGDDILVSDYLAPDRSQTGAVYLYDGDSPSLLRTFINPTGVLNDEFGATMAAIGDKILIGAPRYERPDDRQSGAVYLFSRNTGELLDTIYGTGTSPIERFGQSLAVEGNRALIGGQQSGPQGLFDGRTLNLIQNIPATSPVPPVYYTDGAFVDRNVALSQYAENVEARVVKLLDGNSGALIADLRSPRPSSTAQLGPAAAAGSDVLIRYLTENSVLLFDGAAAPGPSMLTIAPETLSRFRPRFENPQNIVTGAVFQTRTVGDGVEFEISMGTDDAAPYQSEVAIGISAAELGLTSIAQYEGLAFRVTNTDNSEWDVAAYVRLIDGTFRKGSYTKLSLLGSSYVTLAFPATGWGPSAELGVFIRGNMDGAAPNPSNGDIAHILVETVSTATAVPEPSTVVLLTGLGFVAALRRRIHPAQKCSRTRSLTSE